MPDYTKLSGAEFQRAVGADPEKWAAAFMQWDGSVTGWRADPRSVMDRDRSEAEIAKWFRDFGEAVLRAHRDKAAHSGDWRQLLSE